VSFSPLSTTSSLNLHVDLIITATPSFSHIISSSNVKNQYNMILQPLYTCLSRELIASLSTMSLNHHLLQISKWQSTMVEIFLPWFLMTPSPWHHMI